MAAEPASVPPLGSYLATRCPLRVQLDLVEPRVALEPTAADAVAGRPLLPPVRIADCASRSACIRMVTEWAVDRASLMGSPG